MNITISSVRKRHRNKGELPDSMHDLIYPEYCRLRSRLLWHKMKYKDMYFGLEAVNDKNIRQAYNIRIEFFAYNPDEAEYIARKIKGFVKDLHFTPSKCYGGKYQGLTYYIKPDWKYFAEVTQEARK